jgi:hypothetical protein
MVILKIIFVSVCVIIYMHFVSKRAVEENEANMIEELGELPEWYHREK